MQGKFYVWDLIETTESGTCNAIQKSSLIDLIKD